MECRLWRRKIAKPTRRYSEKDSRYDRASSPEYFCKASLRKDLEREKPPQDDTGWTFRDLFGKYTTSNKGRF